MTDIGLILPDCKAGETCHNAQLHLPRAEKPKMVATTCRWIILGKAEMDTTDDFIDRQWMENNRLNRKNIRTETILKKVIQMNFTFNL